MCPPAAPGRAQSSWGRRGSPTFHRRQSPARAGCGKCAQGHRAEGPQILGGHWPHGWAGGGETGEGLTRHQPALPRRTEPLSQLPWYSQQRTTPGRAQARALSPPAGGGPVVTPSRRAGEPTPVHTCPPASPQRRGTHAPAGTLQQPVSRARCALFRRGRASRSTGGARAGDGGGQPGGAEHHWWLERAEGTRWGSGLWWSSRWPGQPRCKEGADTCPVSPSPVTAWPA